MERVSTQPRSKPEVATHTGMFLLYPLSGLPICPFMSTRPRAPAAPNVAKQSATPNCGQHHQAKPNLKTFTLEEGGSEIQFQLRRPKPHNANLSKSSKSEGRKGEIAVTTHTCACIVGG